MYVKSSPIRPKQTDKRNMKKRIAIHLALSLTTYTVIYFLTCFVTWDLKNPFQWIIDLPKYSSFGRVNILFCFAGAHVVLNLVSSELSKSK